MTMMVTMTAQESLGVARISLSVTTMDDVFLKIGEMTDAKVSLPATIQANYSKGGNFRPNCSRLHWFVFRMLGRQEEEEEEEEEEEREVQQLLGHQTLKLRPGLFKRCQFLW